MDKKDMQEIVNTVFTIIKPKKYVIEDLEPYILTALNLAKEKFNKSLIDTGFVNEELLTKSNKEISRLKAELRKWTTIANKNYAEIMSLQEEHHRVGKEVEWLINAIENGPLEDLDIANIKKRFARWLPEKVEKHG